MRTRQQFGKRTTPLTVLRRIGMVAVLALITCCIMFLRPTTAQAVINMEGDFNHNLKIKGLNWELPDDTYPYDCMLWDIDRTEDEIADDPHRILDDFSKGNVIFMAGGCTEPFWSNWGTPNNSAATLPMVEQFQHIMDDPAFKDVTLVVMDLEFGDREAFTEEYLSYCSDRIRFVSAPSNESYIWYAIWADKIFSQLDPNYTLYSTGLSGSFDEDTNAGNFKTLVKRPACFYMKDGRIKAISTGEVSLSSWICDAFGISGYTGMLQLDLQGDYDADAAYSMCKGTGLTWDSALESICMTLLPEYMFTGDFERPSYNTADDLFMGRLEGSKRNSTRGVTGDGSIPTLWDGLADNATAIGAACIKDPDGKLYYLAIAADPAGGGDGKRCDVPMDASVYLDKQWADSLTVKVKNYFYDEDETLQCGTAGPLLLVSNDATIRDYEVARWSSSNTSVVTIDDEGYYEAIGAGQATITATLKDDSKISGSVDIRIAPADFESWYHDVRITLPQSTYTATGKAIEPQPTVICDSKTLKQGTDYTVSYENNVNPGTARVYVTGKGNYSGTKSVSFTIEQGSSTQKVDISNATIDAIANQTYTGSAIKPKVTVRYNGKTLAEGTDYTCSYSNNTNVGTARVTVTGIGNYTGTKTASFAIVSNSTSGKWKRLEGNGRYDTMKSIVSAGFDESEWAVVAYGKNFPDALVASSLAGYLDAPVILSDCASLSSQAESELKRLGVEYVFIMGGESAISTKAEKQIQKLGIGTYRVAGSDRQKTSLRAFEILEDYEPETVVIATGYSFADVLSIAPWCYANCAPILLTNKSGKLSRDQINAIREIDSIVDIVIVGGSNSVSKSIEDEFDDFYVTRIAGSDRYDTSAKIASWELRNGMSLNTVAVASGQTFPDALAGSALCGSQDGVLLLTKPDGSKSALSVLEGKSVSKGYILGGTSSVSNAVMQRCESLTK